MGGGMSTRREYFRIRCYARVGLRVVDDVEESAARARVRTRSIPRAFAPGALEAQNLPSEQLLALGLLKYIALSLDRIERRIDDVARRAGGMQSELLSSDAPVEVCPLRRRLCRTLRYRPARQDARGGAARSR